MENFIFNVDVWTTIVWFSLLLLWPVAAIIAIACWFPIYRRITTAGLESNAKFALAMSLINLLFLVLMLVNLQAVVLEWFPSVQFDVLAWFPSKLRPIVMPCMVFFPWISMCGGLLVFIRKFR